MNERFKVLWLEALKSGKFRHYKHCLRKDENRFCALGVLCDVISPNKWRFNNQHERYWQHCGRYAFPDDNVLNLAGINKSKVEIIINLNEKATSFDEVINYIETHL